jgi:hypothetical protein
MQTIRTLLADAADRLASSLRTLSREKDPSTQMKEPVTVEDSDLFDDDDLGDIAAEASALDDVLPEVDQIRAADAASDGFPHADEGDNWIEAMELDVIESGPTPEKPVLLDEDGTPIAARKRSSRYKDTPVADLGVGGRNGR